MNFLSKLRGTHDARSRGVSPGMSRVMAAPADRDARAASGSARLSNALKEFLWLLEGTEHGRLLDLGPVWQSTVSFFAERGFRVYTDDLLLAWRQFLRAEEERLRGLKPGEDTEELTPVARAERFLRENLQYQSGSFDAVLAWDLLDYFDHEIVKRVVQRLGDLLKPGGVVLALFHNRKVDAFYRFRILNAENLECVPTPVLLPVQRIFQNREILNLFSDFHSSKTFMGRDQLREGIFIK